MRYVLASCIVCVTVMTTFSARAADSQQALTQSSVQAVSRISGSVVHTTMQPVTQSNSIPQTASAVVRAAASEPGDPQNITAVCLTSGSNSDRCGATVVPTSAAGTGCQEGGRYNGEEGAIDEPMSWCHGRAEPVYTHAPHVAICDVDDVGLSGCLEKYASSLVKRPDAAKHAYQVDVGDHDDAHRAITVLVTAKQTDHDAEKMALNSIASAPRASTN
jgi:hypothetical protein